MESYIAIFLASFSTTLAPLNCNTEETGALPDNTQKLLLLRNHAQFSITFCHVTVMLHYVKHI